jgi:hypothetical protein
MDNMPQTDKLAFYLNHLAPGGASSMEIMNNLHIINVTGRISDLRKQGYTIVCKRNKQGVFVFYMINNN